MRINLNKTTSWVGYIDWELKHFHGDDYLIKNGSSQNAYLIEEEKTVLIDTVWGMHRCEFIENLKKEIDLKKIDFIVINHSEQDHCGALPALLKYIPNLPIYCSAVAKNFITGQYGGNFNFNIVKDKDEIDIGNGKKLIFLDMKMLHWPDSMATYLTGDNILFSNDAFGQHFAINEIFSKKADKHLLEKEALKYFVNILNPFANILAKKLQQIKQLNIKTIAPSHGAIWQDDSDYIIDKYINWAQSPKKNQITIAYDSMWGGTKNIAHKISNYISTKNPNIAVKLYNISKEDKNEIAMQIFNSFAVIIGSPTVNNSILSSVAGFLEYIKQLKFKNKIAAGFGCYGWSGESKKILQEKLQQAGFEVLSSIGCLWTPKQDDEENIKNLVFNILEKSQ